MTARQPPVIERAAPNDLMELASDVGPVPMNIGGLLVLHPGSGLDVAAAVTTLGARASTVPRLRQRLVPTPLGCGRAIWVDDPGFDVTAHIAVRACLPPGDEAALLDTAVAVVTRPLPRSRAPWAATFVTGCRDGAVGLVIVMHHVVADGIGGLAVLRELVDGGNDDGTSAGAPFPRPAPGRAELAVDAWTARARATAQLPAQRSKLRAARAELGAQRVRTAPVTSLNRPTGTRRRLDVVRADLDAVRAVAHAHAGTVNDAVLSVIAGALAALLRARGEPVPDRLVFSVPVSARPVTGSAQLGNRVGAIPVALPTGGLPGERLRSVAALTGARKSSTPGASAALLQPVFRAMGAMRLLGWFLDHQRLVNTFVTNLRGPADPMSFLGARVSDAIPITGTYGNVTVSFAVLSYAGTLVLTVVADPDAVADLAVLVTALRHELAALTDTRAR